MKETCSFDTHDETPHLIVLAVAVSCIITNLLCILAIVRSNVHNSLCLLSLVLSNMFLMIFSVIPPVYSILSLNDCMSEISASYRGYVEQPLKGAASTFSIYIIFVTTAERFISIYYPMLYRRVYCARINRLLLISSFFLAVLIKIPAGASRKTCLTKNTSCWHVTSDFQIVTSKYWTTYVWIDRLMTKFVPGLFIFALNAAIVAKYWRIVNNRTRLTTGATLSTSSTTNLAVHSDDKRVLILFSLVSLFTLIFFIPSAIISSVSMSFAFIQPLQLLFYPLISVVYSLYSNDVYRQVRQLLKCPV